MALRRRRFIQLAGALFLPRALAGCPSNRDGSDGVYGVDLGPLTRDAQNLLDLPEGYRYVVLERTGDMMSDGHAVGGRPDGMACFWDDDGNYVLMRNHEVDIGGAVAPEVAYNPNRGGGVSRVVIDPRTIERISSNWVLTGTSRNCAGGPSPWGWLSCEETSEVGHGYVFLCDPYAREAQKPQRCRTMGRFDHEAVAIDPATNIAYLTEDYEDGALYRHVPIDPDKPFEGRLQAMVIKNASRRDLNVDLSIGDQLEVEWVRIADPDAESTTTAAQAHTAGAAFVRRGEGIWYSDGAIFFAASTGGPRGEGQIFRLDPRADGDLLTLVAQAEDEGSFLNPDNLTVAPWGDLMVCEDNAGPCHVHRVNMAGEVHPFVRNALDGGISELCGVCFSPDGRVMFVNIQEPGITLAITGPFPS